MLKRMSVPLFLTLAFSVRQAPPPEQQAAPEPSSPIEGACRMVSAADVTLTTTRVVSANGVRYPQGVEGGAHIHRLERIH